MSSSQDDCSSKKKEKSKKAHLEKKNKDKNQAISSLHGNIYHLKLLMLFLYRGVSHGYSFRLGAEIEEAGKFDDLTFEYTQNGKKVYRLLQAKHKLDESRKIKEKNLLKKEKDDYWLTKYCDSYVSSKKNDLFTDGSIKDVIICTNINFDFENLQREKIEVEEITDKDDILDVVGREKQPQRYRISQALATSGEITVDVKKITVDEVKEITVDKVKDFLQHLVFAVNQPNEEELEIIIKDELGKIFDLDFKTKEVYNKLFQTILNLCRGKYSFLSSKEGKKFFVEAKRVRPIWFGVRDPVESVVGRDEQLDNLHKMLQSGDATVISQAVSQSGLGAIGKSELVRKYINKLIKDYVDEVKDFLDHLVFAVNQPNEQELEIIIKEELGTIFDLDSKTKEDVYNKFFVTMLNWFTGKNNNRFFSSEEGHKFFEETKRGVPISFDVRDPIESFVGREEQLNNLHKMLQSGNATVISQGVSISGLGGIGKSELARMYISKHSQDYDNKIIWINAENYQTFSESFHRLACDKLGMCTKNPNGEEKEMKSILEDVYNFFTHGKSLFVFDNVEKYRSQNVEKYRSQNEFDCGIDTFLSFRPPINNNRPYILITSRNQRWPEKIEAMILDVLTEEEAIKFIKNSLRIPNDTQDKEIKDLSKKLQYFPLALQQAVSYIRVKNDEMKNVNSSFQISDYLERFEEKTKELLNFEFPEYSDNEYMKTTYITWNVTLAIIKGKENGEVALEILNIISYLAAENIPVELLFNLPYDKEKLGSAIELLKQHSMVNSESGMLNIHRLVQQVTRIQLQNEKKEEDTLRNVLELFKINNISSNVLDHARVAWNYSTNYNKLIEEFPWVSFYIINELTKSNKYEEAYSFALEALELFKALRLDFHILNTKTQIAGVLVKKGKYSDASKAYQEILTIKKEILGENHPDLLLIRYHLAEIKRLKSKYKAALEDFRKIFEQERIILGDDHPDTLTTQYSLAFTLDNQGNHSEALKIFEEVLKKREAILGYDHVDTLKAKNQIAIINSKQGSYDKALQMYQEILADQERILGLNHWDTQATKNNMGMVLYNKKEYNEALKIFQEVFNTLQRIFSNHPDTLYVKNNIALVLSSQEKDDKALEIFKQILVSQENSLGTTHHECRKTKNNIAKILLKQGKYYEALEVFEVLDGFNKVLGPENEETREVSNIVQSLIVLPEILITIVKNNDFNKLKKSIEKGGNINSKDNNYFTLLHHAVNTGNTDMVQFLLENGADVNQISKKGNTPLHIATSKGLKEIIEVLLQHASNNKLNEFINAKTTSAGTTALHVAVKTGSLEIVMSLLKHGAIYDIKNKEGKVPLDFSNDPNISNLLELTVELFGDAKNGNDCVIKKLKELEIEKFEAVMKTQNNQGNTLIQVAEVHKHHIVAKKLSEILKTRS